MTREEEQRVVQAALLRLASDICPEAGMLQVSVVDDPGVVAYINDKGVAVGRKVVEKDPFNLHVYIAHELLHPVVEDAVLTGEFDYQILNWAYDYRINQILQSKFKYDVTKVRFKGLRNRAYDKLSVRSILNHLVDKVSNGAPELIVHQIRPEVLVEPVTQAVIDALVLKAGVAFARKEVQIVYSDGLFDDLWTSYYHQVTTCTHKGVNTKELMRILWHRMYDPPAVRWMYSKLRSTASPTQVLGLLIPVPDVSHDPYLAFYTAMKAIRSVNEHGAGSKGTVEHRATVCLKAVLSKLRRMKERLTYTATKQQRRQIRAKLKAAQLRYEKKKQLLQDLKNIGRLLPNEYKFRKGSLGLRYEAASTTPRIIGPTARDLLRSIKFCLDDLEDFVETMNKLRKSTAGLPDVTEEEENTQPDTTPQVEDAIDSDSLLLDTDTEQSEGGDNPASGDGTSASDEDGADSSSSRKIPRRNGKGEGSDLGRASSEDPKIDGEGDSLGSGKGSGNGSSVNLKVTQVCDSNNLLLKAILEVVGVFESTIKIKTNSSSNPDGLVDRTLTTGCDVSRAVQSELGRLGSELTRLSFLVDLANNNLTQYSDFDPSRSGSILMVDTSGSMMTKNRYPVAAAFCFVMMIKLAKAKRGVALILFHGQVYKVVVVDKNNPLSVLKLLALLANPSSGGTNFDAALTKAYQIAEANGWTKVTHVLLSDMEDRVSESVVSLKPPGDRNVALLCGKTSCRQLPSFDETIVVASKDGMIKNLTKIGKSL